MHTQGTVDVMRTSEDEDGKMALAAILDEGGTFGHELSDYDRDSAQGTS